MIIKYYVNYYLNSLLYQSRIFYYDEAQKKFAIDQYELLEDKALNSIELEAIKCVKVNNINME